MSAQHILRLRNPALLIALSAAFPVISYAAGAANIDFAAGRVTAVNAAGVQRPLTKGAEISNGDTIHTGDGGRAQVRFSDGAMISLQPETEFRVDNYQYSGKADGQEKGFFSLLKGGLRTITGWVGRSNRDNYKVTTSVATIGIRGTEYSAVLGDDSLNVHTGEGLVEVCNNAGCMLLASGESGIVAKDKAPLRTDLRPQLPPNQPDNNVLPVVSVGDTIFLPTSPMPASGTATYSTILSQSIGASQLTSATLAVNFGTLGFSANLQGKYNLDTFSANASGSISGNNLPSTALSSFGGSFCLTSCTGSVSGTFYGAAAERVGLNYSIKDTSSTTASGSAILK